jgi:hypothetical protein
LIPSRPDSKGQVATEFMLYTTVFMFVAIAAFVVVNSVQSSEIPLQQNTVAKEVGDGFATVITLAVKGGPGFAYNYSFPKTVFNLPYRLALLPNGHNVFILDWSGAYGNFSYQYDVPAYGYSLEGCLADGEFVSDECENMLMFRNNGSTLTIEQVAS